MTAGIKLSALSRADARELYEQAVEMEAPQAPLYKAASEGLLSLFRMLDPDSLWPADLMDENGTPALVLIADDPGPDTDAERRGPGGWTCATEAAEWAQSVMLHAAIGTHVEYLTAAAKAVAGHRVLVVETSPIHVMRWGDALNCLRTFIVMPSSGRHASTPAVLQ